MLRRLTFSLVFLFCVQPVWASVEDEAMAYLALAKALQAQKNINKAVGPPKTKCPCGCGCKGGNVCTCKTCSCDCGCDANNKCFCEVLTQPVATDAYADAYKQALTERKNLVVIVGGQRSDLQRALPNTVICKVEKLEGAAPGTIVAAIFSDGKLLRVADVDINTPSRFIFPDSPSATSVELPAAICVSGH